MRTAFYISDGTAITAEVFGHALLSLFPVEFNHNTIPFVETEEEANKVANRIRAGQIQVNGARPDFTAPFGGYGQSGNGREWGEEGFEEFLEVKAVIGYKAA